MTLPGLLGVHAWFALARSIAILLLFRPRPQISPREDRHATSREETHLHSGTEGREPAAPAMLHQRQMGPMPIPAMPSMSPIPPRARCWHSAEHGCGRDPARHRGGQCRLAGLAQEDGQGARQHSAQMVQPDDGKSGRFGNPYDRRTGQAAGRSQGRDRLWCLLRRMVRRGSQARLRRYHHAAPARQAHRGDQGADRRRCRDHPLEFPPMP